MGFMEDLAVVRAAAWRPVARGGVAAGWRRGRPGRSRGECGAAHASRAPRRGETTQSPRGDPPRSRPRRRVTPQARPTFLPIRDAGVTACSPELRLADPTPISLEEVGH